MITVEKLLRNDDLNWTKKTVRLFLQHSTLPHEATHTGFTYPNILSDQQMLPCIQFSVLSVAFAALFLCMCVCF